MEQRTIVLKIKPNTYWKLKEFAATKRMTLKDLLTEALKHYAASNNWKLEA